MLFGHDCCIPYQAPAYFYTALLFLGGLYILPSEIGKYSYYVAELGKASWHIFLFQMLYFWLLPVEYNEDIKLAHKFSHSNLMTLPHT